MLAHLSRPGSDADRRAAGGRAAAPGRRRPARLRHAQAPAVPVPATIVRVVTADGMASWQITLVAVGAALAGSPGTRT